MLAIDFDMDITRKADPKGDWVQIGMTGKFLPFKYYGVMRNALAYGLKGERRILSCHHRLVPVIPLREAVRL